MTHSDFDRWVRDYCAKFPSVAAWLTNLGELVQGQQLTLWRDILGDVELRDAMRVTLMMARDQLERVGSFDHQRETTAVVIRRACKQMAEDREREPQQGDDGPSRRWDRPAGAPAPRSGKQLMEEYSRLLASGRSKQEIAAELFPSRGLATNEPRYRCHLCQDTGRVDVWHTEAMHAWRSGPEALARCIYRIMVAPCSCKRADHLCLADGDRQQRRGHKWSQGVRYTPERWCRVMHGDTNGEEALTVFGAWCEGFWAVVQQQAEARLERDAQTSLPYKE